MEGGEDDTWGAGPGNCWEHRRQHSAGRRGSRQAGLPPLPWAGRSCPPAGHSSLTTSTHFDRPSVRCSLIRILATPYDSTARAHTAPARRSGSKEHAGTTAPTAGQPEAGVEHAAHSARLKQHHQARMMLMLQNGWDSRRPSSERGGVEDGGHRGATGIKRRRHHDAG